MAFRGRPSAPAQQFSSPEELYLSNVLPRTTDAVGSLWLHQGDVVRAYAHDHQSTPDLALELPTGTGKTLPGLLIAEWVRRKGEGAVLYATPTRQLGSQVISTAQREGIPVAHLAGPARDWEAISEASVLAGEAIGVTTYSSIFNSSPKLPASPRLIVFDDAHAGEQFVGNEYAITIRRRDDPATYLAVLEPLKSFLEPLQMQRLEAPREVGLHQQVRLIVPLADAGAMSELDSVLGRLEKPHSYTVSMLHSALASCCVYLSYDSIQIRPMVPPTFENRVFSGAQQRLYLSATLGGGGELERTFGQRDIVRMPLPTQTRPRSGRRLFVFPDIAHGDPEELARRIVALTDKALVLTQASVADTEATGKALAGDGVPVFGREDLERDGLESFAQASKGILALANRYDGLDLPGPACRIVVLAGSPDAISLQERFLSERADASAALAERLRTRIVQGAGRCTRGPNDFAVVVVLGHDLMGYFANTGNRRALEPELQAEVDFGWENSRAADPEDVLDNVETFLEHGVAWRQDGEPRVAEFRQAAVKVDAPGTAELQAAAPLEVDAWRRAATSDWTAASATLQEAARLASAPRTRGYRAMLLYLAGVWLHAGAADEAQAAQARELIRQASEAADRGTWVKEMKALPNTPEPVLAEEDVKAVKQIVTMLRGKLNPTQTSSRLEKMQTDLQQTKAEAYEHGLSELGHFLGAKAYKPQGQGRCDSAWLWGTALWMTIEAKSEENSDRKLSLHDIRQANTQLDHLAADMGMDNPPPDSVAIIVSGRMFVDPQDAPSANSFLYLTSPDTVATIACDVVEVWKDLLATSRGKTPEQPQRHHVRQLLAQNGCLPSQVAERLTRNRVRPGD